MSEEISHILSAIEQGEPVAAEKLLPLVYQDLRRLAARRLAREGPGQSLLSSAIEGFGAGLSHYMRRANEPA